MRHCSSKDRSATQDGPALPWDRPGPRGQGWRSGHSKAGGTRPCQLPPGPWPAKIPRGDAEPLLVWCLVRPYAPEAVALVSSHSARGSGRVSLRAGLAWHG